MSKSKKSDAVKVICTCDRLPLANGHVLVRDQKAELSAEEAKNYSAAERVAIL